MSNNNSITVIANARAADRGWPDKNRPGVPMSPDSVGAHRLRDIGGMCEPTEEFDVIWDGNGYVGSKEYYSAEEAGKFAAYLGPCLTPAQHAAAVQAEREAIAWNLEAIGRGVSNEFGTEIPECPALLTLASEIRARGTTDAVEDAIWRGIAEFQQDVDHATLQRIGCMVVDYVRALPTTASAETK